MQIEKTYDLPFRARDIFTAWTSSDAVVPPATRLDLNPVVGGHIKLFMETPEKTASAEGIFFLVEPDRRIRYTWEWNRDGEITEIQVTFEDYEAGTHVTLLHSGFQSEESRDRHIEGWDNYVGGLEKLLGADPDVQAFEFTEETA